MITAWLYAAVSSDKQADDLPAQEAWATDVAKQHDWIITRVFSDSGTGKHGPRKLIRTLLDELRVTKSPPQIILMNRLDRVGRGKVSDSQLILAEITARGVHVFTRESGFVQNESWTDELINAVRFAVARQENEAKADRSKAGHATRKAQGKHAGHAPYGTVLINGIPRPYEPEANIVRELFHRYVYMGWGRHRLGAWAAANAPAKRKHDGSLRKMKWSQSSIDSVLKCQTHRGLTVGEAIWDAAQSQQRRGPFVRSSRFTWFLRGVVKCSCGHALTGHSGSKNKTIRYYACRYTAGHGGSIILHRADSLEARFEEIIRTLPEFIDPQVMHEESTATLGSLKSQRTALQSELSSIEARKSRVWEIAEAGAIEAREVNARINALTEEKTRLASALGDLDRQITPLEQSTALIASAQDVVQTMTQLWDRAGDSEKQDVARAVSALLGGFYVKPEAKGLLWTGLELTNYRKSTELQTFVNTFTAVLLVVNLAARGPLS